MRFYIRKNGCVPSLNKFCIYVVPRLVLLGIIITFVIFSARKIYDLSNRSIRLESNDLPYAADDEPFLHLVDEMYKDEDLHEWEPAVYNGTKPGDLGHLGVAFWVPHEFEALANKRFPEHQINIVASEMMSYNRTLPDSRHPNCRLVEYPKKLPQTAVIIVFYNEAFSVLMRTVWNVYSKSPRALVKEIILVDDASNHTELGQKLDEYVKTIPVKVVVVRMMKRAGLIQAKILGAKYVTAPVMTFLDAHMEMNEGWLEPLLTIVAQDRTSIANPVMDQIQNYQMGYSSRGLRHLIAMIDWSFIVGWIDIPERERKRTNNDPTAPLRMPAMVGGLFSIDREYFHKLGTYDGGMNIWGGDDIEMSVRIWLCGGSILVAPCSRMGHLTRAKRINDGPLGWLGLILTNTARFVDVWADEWSEYFYGVYPQALRWRTDVTERKQLRKDLKCKSFRWYLKNVFPESSMNWKPYHLGLVESALYEGYCFARNRIVPCAYGTGNYVYMLTKEHEIRAKQMCLNGESPEKPLSSKFCDIDNKQGSQKFAYINETRSFEFNDTGYCLHVEDDKTIVLKPCDGSLAQEWNLVKIKLS